LGIQKKTTSHPLQEGDKVNQVKGTLVQQSFFGASMRRAMEIKQTEKSVVL